MTAAIIANFGFEHELAGRPVPSIVARQSERFSHVLRLVPGWRHARPLADTEQPDRVIAWGPSETARALAGECARDWPAPHVVRLANDKRTSHRLETELGIGLPNAAIVTSRDDLDEAIAPFDAGWIAKDPWGVAGRGQIRGVPDDPEAVDRLRRALDEGGEFVLEPLVEIDREFSLHFDVSNESVEFIGAADLLTDRRGTFRGNRVPGTATDEVVASGCHVAERLRLSGWRGPIGIDGFEGVDRGRKTLRHVSEINARWSFGRLTLELSAVLDGASLTWWHPRRGTTEQTSNVVSPDSDPGIYRLPDFADPEGASGTYVELGRGGETAAGQQ